LPEMDGAGAEEGARAALADSPILCQDGSGDCKFAVRPGGRHLFLPGRGAP
jgi:hypothetical protein